MPSEILHFYSSWLMSQCYSWICILLSWVSKQSHGGHPERTAECVHNMSLQWLQISSKRSHHVCLALPVRMNPFGDHRLRVIFEQVPHVEVRGCIKHTEDCRSGLRPLQWHYRFTSCTILPLCHRLFKADCMQPDATIPTSHLEHKGLKVIYFFYLLLCYFDYELSLCTALDTNVEVKNTNWKSFYTLTKNSCCMKGEKWIELMSTGRTPASWHL